MIPSLVVVIIAWGLAGFLVIKKEPEDQKRTWATLPAAIGALSLMAGVPGLLIRGTEVPQVVAMLIGAAGLATAFATVGFKKIPAIFLFIGMVVAAWGLFRAFPHVADAFITFGENMGAVGDSYWAAISGTGEALWQLGKDLLNQ